MRPATPHASGHYDLSGNHTLLSTSTLSFLSKTVTNSLRLLISVAIKAMYMHYV